MNRIHLIIVLLVIISEVQGIFFRRRCCKRCCCCRCCNRSCGGGRCGGRGCSGGGPGRGGCGGEGCNGGGPGSRRRGDGGSSIGYIGGCGGVAGFRKRSSDRGLEPKQESSHNDDTGDSSNESSISSSDYTDNHSDSNDIDIRNKCGTGSCPLHRNFANLMPPSFRIPLFGINLQGMRQVFGVTNSKKKYESADATQYNYFM